MSVYADTSVLVSALTLEAATERANAWLRRQAPGNVFISDWCHTEVASALSLKVRTGEIDLTQRASALAAWHRISTSSLPTLAVMPEHFEAAARIASQHELGLRAGDALHLAIAQDGGHTIVTLDARMTKAALQIGIPVEAIESLPM